MKKTLLSLIAAAALSTSVYGVEDKVYATVNGDTITNSDIAVLLKNPRLKFEDLSKVQQDKVLDNLIEQKLLSQEAMRSNIVNTKEYKEELEKLKQTLAFQIWMRDIGKTIEASDKEVKDFYNKNKERYKAPLQLKASHILVKTQAEADEIIKTLKKAANKKETFTKLAKEKSTGPSGPNGGELGWFTKEKMVPQFSEAASQLDVGQVSKNAVKTQFGYHVIYLDDKKEAQTISFEKIKNNVKQQLLQNKFVETVKNKAQKLKEKAKITYTK